MAIIASAAQWGAVGICCLIDIDSMIYQQFADFQMAGRCCCPKWWHSCNNFPIKSDGAGCMWIGAHVQLIKSNNLNKKHGNYLTKTSTIFA